MIFLVQGKFANPAGSPFVTIHHQPADSRQHLKEAAAGEIKKLQEDIQYILEEIQKNLEEKQKILEEIQKILEGIQKILEEIKKILEETQKICNNPSAGSSWSYHSFCPTANLTDKCL